jgi:hypothetical protein
MLWNDKGYIAEGVPTLFSAEFATEVIEMFGGAHIFDKTELSRGRPTVDVALMLWWRQRNTSDL